MTEYIRVGQKKLRTGFTTGTCAAGAAKAAVLAFLQQKTLTEVEVILPDGRSVILPLSSCELTAQGGKASITKDGGDDPDVTTGLQIVVEVELTSDKEIVLLGGEGVGQVTLKGLKVPVGEPAINPVPRGMILTNVKSVLPSGAGAVVTVSVPGGQEIAKKTFNPRLGIKDGISILGSTGIVYPMSEDALKKTFALELSILVNKGYLDVIFAFGNYGMSFLKEQGVNLERVVKISNYVGFMLDEAVNQRVERIILVGHIGKMVKVAGGIFQTHNRSADYRMEVLTSYAALEGVSQELAAEIFACPTTVAAMEVIEREGLENIYQRIVDNTVQRAENYVFGEIEIGAILFGNENRLLAIDPKAKSWIKEFADA